MTRDEALAAVADRGAAYRDAVIDAARAKDELIGACLVAAEAGATERAIARSAAVVSNVTVHAWLSRERVPS